MRIITVTLLLCLVTIALPVADAASREVTIVRHPRSFDSQDTRNEYFLELLQLVLDKTVDSHGPYLLMPHDAPLNQGRAISQLARGDGLDVLWTMTSREREQKLRPVRIPLLKGLMGYRVCIVRTSDMERFRQLHDVAQLRQLVAGQGHDWPDAEILRANGFQVDVTSRYDALFEMLQAGRLDFLPRALVEPWEEVAARPEMKLAVEDSLLLYYPTASYFFVNPSNTPLARRLEAGLREALADGSFDALFRAFPAHRRALEEVNLRHRRVLRLDNPLLPDGTPLSDASLWWAAE